MKEDSDCCFYTHFELTLFAKDLMQSFFGGDNFQLELLYEDFFFFEHILQADDNPQAVFVFFKHEYELA